MMAAAASGKHLESVRGYSIFEWDGPGVESGEYKRFSAGPMNSFDWKRFDTLEKARAWVASAPTLRKITVTFEAYLPSGVEADDDQIQDWVEYELHANGSIESNPLMDHGLEAIYVEPVDVTEVG